jgi:hypothetical protein
VSEVESNLKHENTTRKNGANNGNVEIHERKGEADRKATQEVLLAMQKNGETTQEEMEAGHKELLAKLEADRQADWKSWREEMAAMRKGMDSSHKEMVIEIKPERDMKTMACRETKEARLEKELTSLDRKPEAAEHQEVPI